MTNKEKADAMARELVPHVHALLLAQVHAKVEQERMDKIDRELIEEMRPVDQYSGEPITDPRKLWHMDDATAAEFYKARHILVLKAGYKPKSEGECPALVAEGIVRLAQRTLIEGAQPFMGVSPDDLLCAGLEKYRRYVELIVGLVVNHPTFKPPRLVA